MILAITAIAATILSALIYLYVGLRIGDRVRVLGDLLPVDAKNNARVASATEFSASTVAATISMATVVLAFFELAPYFGLWLLWTVATTAAGIVVVRVAGRVIWVRMSVYKSRRPTLHEFLGTEYGTSSVALVGASCTTLGFLGAFAVELTVGSRFLAGVIPSIPPWALVTMLAAVGLIYTSMGGFRAVIVTDRIQMVTIWVFIAALAIFYAIHIGSSGGLSIVSERVPRTVYDFSWRDGLASFLLGILIINVPTFMSDMSIWQRFAGTRDSGTVLAGLWRSAVGASVSWSCLAILACLVFVVVEVKDGQNPLLPLLSAIVAEGGVTRVILGFLVVFGLYGAMFSTASTQLIAVTHTIYEDLLPRRPNPQGDAAHSREVFVSRTVLVLSAASAIGIVAVLAEVGFSIADLVFAVYGAQLGLFPPVLTALLCKRERLSALAPWAATAIALGFSAGWTCAAYGKLIGNSDLVFLAPAASLAASAGILGLGLLRSGSDR